MIKVGTLIYLFISLTLASPTNGERGSLDIVTQYLEMGIEPDTLSPCSFNGLQERMSFIDEKKCNEDVRANYKATQRFSVYSLFHSDRPFNQCMKDIQLSKEEILETKKILSENANRDGLYQHFAFQCQEALGTNEDDYDMHSLMLQAGHNLRLKKLEAIALQSMRGLNNLDNILGRELIEKEVQCNDNISQKVESACETFKSCPQRRGRVFFQSNMTLDALKTMDDLDHLIEETEKKIRSLRRSRRTRSRENREKAEQLEFVLEDLKRNKADIASTVPWIEGKELKKDIEKFKERMDKLRDDEGNIRDSSQKRSLISDIGYSLVKQFKADRKELLKRFDDANKGIICLDHKKECDGFEKTLKLSPPIDVSEFENNEDPGMINTYKLIKANQCIDEKAQSVRTYRDTAIDVASIGAGFLMGGVGGFVRLASVAGRMYVRGNRIKGLASAAVLGLEGTALAAQGSDVISSCSMARRNLSNFELAETSVSCQGDDEQMTVMTNYSECLKDIAFLSVGAIAGVAPDIVKGFKRTSVSLTRQSDNIERVADILDEVKIPQNISRRMKDQVQRLGIKENEKEEFVNLLKKMEPWDSKKLSGKNLDEDLTTLVYFNQLSARNRKVFLENFPDKIKAADSGGISGFRLKRMRKQFQRAQRKMDAVQNSAQRKMYQKLRKQGIDEEHAKRQSELHGREIRQSKQEREFGCRANKMTEQHRKGAALFTNFTVGFGLSSTAATFTMANSDRPKDFEFAKDLGYELSMAFIMSKIGARIQSKPSNTLLGRYGQSTVYSTGLGTIDAAIFANVYDMSDEDVEDQIQRIQNSPDQMAALEKYERYFKEENIMKRIEESILKQFEHSLNQPETSEYFNQTEVKIGGKTFSGPINTASMQDPKLKEEIVEAIMEEFYEDARGVYGTGSLFADKFLYDRGYNALFGIPRAMTAGYLTYTALCRNADQPVKGLATAFGIQAINQAIGGYLYYDLRKDFVGR